MTAVPAVGRDDVVDVELLDPRALTAHPRNIRVDLGDLAGLTASIAAQGVIEPLIVVPLPDGGHLVLAGHRRAAAAAAAGLTRVPCVVRPDLSVDVDADRVQAEHVGAMLAENLHRQSLTAVEEARGVQTMLDLGFDVADVSTRTGLDRSRVLKAAGVARLAPAAAAAVADAGLTLDQAAVVVRYEDTPAVVEQLVAAAGEGPGRFAHAVTRAEQDREVRHRVNERMVELQRQGRNSTSDREVGTRVLDLLHDGAVIDQEQHASCPGSIVFVGAYGTTSGVEVYTEEHCLDPAAHGHTQRWGRDPRGGPGASMSDEELERQRAERRQVIENNKAMAAATITRRTWIRELLARPKAPKEVLRFAVEALAADRWAIVQWFESYATAEATDVAKSLHLNRPVHYRDSGVRTLTSGEQVSDAKLPLQLLAHVAGAIESAIPRDAWRLAGDNRTPVARWLGFLAGLGYELADIEQRIVDGTGTTA